MANEIVLGASLSHTQSGTSVSATCSLAITQSSTERITNTQSIPTSSTALTLGNVTPRYVYLKNLDATNFIYVGIVTACTSGNATWKLLPGEATVVPMAQAVLYALADTASVLLEVFAIEA